MGGEHPREVARGGVHAIRGRAGGDGEGACAGEPLLVRSNQCSFSFMSTCELLGHLAEEWGPAHGSKVLNPHFVRAE